jgi:RHS repeat-associated protein
MIRCCHYDPRGNLTKKGSVEYYWSSPDQLTKVVNGNTTTEFKYDLLGRRVAKRVNGGDWWWYFYDGLKVLAEGSATNNRVFYTLGEGAVGGILYRDKGGIKYSYHYDRLGNVMAVTDKDGKPYAEYTMDAFGNILEKGTSTGYYNEHATDPQPYHLTTKEYDPDVGLYYFNARWYDPATGRFVSRSLVTSHWEHSYSYVESSAPNAVDPIGLVKIPASVKHWLCRAKCYPFCIFASACDKCMGPCFPPSLPPPVTRITPAIPVPSAALDTIRQIDKQIGAQGKAVCKELFPGETNIWNMDGKKYGIIPDPNNPANRPDPNSFIDDGFPGRLYEWKEYRPPEGEIPWFW